MNALQKIGVWGSILSLVFAFGFAALSDRFDWDKDVVMKIVGSGFIGVIIFMLVFAIGRMTVTDKR